ncbi:MAG: hypothetical protein J2P37_33755, partial [Ktedonobacteraceae bacterium]|nr:hypothetical protein [Ktedonobacteraceae bacterium]
MLDLLNQLFQRVHTYMREERFDRHAAYRAYAGHTTMAFDYEAENIIIHGLEESGMAFEVITEERDTFRTAPNPTHRIVIDP